VCCNSACSAACQQCSSGSCAAVTNGDDSPQCTGTTTCDAAAACKLKAGQICVYGTDCASGNCSCDKYGTCVCY
jgi:hypothetical protein